MLLDPGGELGRSLGRVLSGEAVLERCRTREQALAALDGAGPAGWDLVIAGGEREEESWTVEVLETVERLAPRTLRVLYPPGSEPLAWLRRAVNRGRIQHLLGRPLEADEIRTLLDDLERLRHPAGPACTAPGSRGAAPELVLESPAMRSVVEVVERVAPLDTTVLLQGETGVGKEVIARLLHTASRRHAGPFVGLNCAALAPGLVESELFGHARGAFTGAVGPRAGKLELAQGGTLLLDEVADIPASTQVKLLRVLEERQLERVGSNASVELDVRIVCATHRDLHRAVESGAFREDLFYRLNVVPLRIPPLRERPEDIVPLARHFLGREAARTGRRVPALSGDAVKKLQAYRWPGNVRELENVISRALALTAPDREITASSLDLSRAVDHPPPPGAGPARGHASADAAPAGGLEERLEAYERSLLASVLARHQGDRDLAARELRLTRQGLTKRLRRHGLDG